LFVRSGFDVDMFLLVNFKHFTIYIGEKVWWILLYVLKILPEIP
jgi:hypothetical protein